MHGSSGIRNIVVSLLAMALPSMALGGTNTVFDFLRTDVSARPAALAGSFVCVANDPVSLFYNPASLGTIEQSTGSVGFFKHLLDINSGFIAYSESFEDLGTFGAGIIYTNYGSFTETDDVGNTIGSFHASDLALSLGYSNTLDENLFYGVAVKLLYSSIATYTSTALAGDLGLFYAIPESRMTMGISIRNLGAQLSTYLGTREDLPLDVTIGASVVPKGLPLLLNINFHRLNDQADSFLGHLRAFSVGGEFTLSKTIQFRVGYDNALRQDLKIGTSAGLAGISAGLGINVKQYRFDYSISSLGKVGELHRVTISSTF
jgi:hypothetical protein